MNWFFLRNEWCCLCAKQTREYKFPGIFFLFDNKTNTIPRIDFANIPAKNDYCELWTEKPIHSHFISLMFDATHQHFVFFSLFFVIIGLVSKFDFLFFFSSFLFILTTVSIVLFHCFFARKVFCICIAPILQYSRIFKC